MLLPPCALDACSDLRDSHDDLFISSGNVDWSSFVIVKDGNCSYEEKARRIQKLGAQAMIIASDTTIEQVDEYIRKGEDPEDIFAPHYDGSGHSVSMPTIIALSPAGQTLIKLVEGESFQREVVVKADIDISYHHQ